MTAEPPPFLSLDALNGAGGRILDGTGDEAGVRPGTYPDTYSGIRHAFFGRAGGVSSGIYHSLNTGLGSDDVPEHVHENRARCARAIGAAPHQLATGYQVHSARAIAIDQPFGSTRPEVDGLVTDRPGLALGILTADCMPWLFFDPEARIIGAAHAGWRGALDGILEATIAVMTDRGASPERIIAGLGPALRQPSFEVGRDLVDAFTRKHAGAEAYFLPDAAPGKFRFDLAGFGAARLRASGIRHIADTRQDTLSAADEYFSHRDSKRQGHPDGGRNLSLIMLRD